MNQHVETIHEGVHYPCSQWDYKGTTNEEAINELFYYSCNICEYKATDKGHPKSQVKSNHECICNPYSQCDYITTNEGNFKKHDKA